jgi:uncharacterized protein involved in exopolysaccharide biosynthesis
MIERLATPPPPSEMERLGREVRTAKRTLQTLLDRLGPASSSPSSDAGAARSATG